jgi:hypothetical protein
MSSHGPHLPATGGGVGLGLSSVRRAADAPHQLGLIFSPFFSFLFFSASSIIAGAQPGRTTVLPGPAGLLLERAPPSNVVNLARVCSCLCALIVGRWEGHSTERLFLLLSSASHSASPPVAACWQGWRGQGRAGRGGGPHPHPRPPPLSRNQQLPPVAADSRVGVCRRHGTGIFFFFYFSFARHSS